VPKSPIRRKRAYTPPTTRSAYEIKDRRWVPILMVACFLIGLVYLVVWYLAGNNLGWMNSIGSWNVAIGFAFVLVGFGIATQWK
jgi:hypothetical protein